MTTKTRTIYTYEDNFKEFITALNKGELCQVDERLWYYFLEVLPPIYMGERQNVTIDGAVFNKMCSFGFAEGCEEITDFWKAGDCYYCKKSNRINRC